MELWNLAADGSDPLQLTKNTIPEVSGEMSPDGSHVLFLARANNRLEPYYNANVFLVAATGGPARALLPDFPNEVLAAGWSTDSRSVWMVVNMGVHSQLFQVDLVSGKAGKLKSGHHSIIANVLECGYDRQVSSSTTRSHWQVWTYSPGASAPVRVTRVYDYLDRDFALPRQERIDGRH